MTYLITYDLDRPGQNYAGLAAALVLAGAVRILLSTWLIVSSENAAQLRDRYRQYLDANDRIFVSHVDGNWAFWNVLSPDEAKRLLPP